jgi:putrescine transport system ATP-binding protein
MAEPKPTLVRLEAVSKRFGRVVAVEALTLDIAQGEFFALLGPSGCGKTTLLRMLAGFETPSEGRILLDGDDIVAVPPHRRPVNMMFQSYALFPHLTVEGNIAFGLRQEHAGKAEITERVADMLALVRLQGYGNRRVDQAVRWPAPAGGAGACADQAAARAAARRADGRARQEAARRDPVRADGAATQARHDFRDRHP